MSKGRTLTGNGAVTLLAACLLAASDVHAAPADPRTPAEIEQRREAIHAELVALDRRREALVAARAALHEAPATGDLAQRADVEERVRDLDTALGRVADELARLHREEALLARTPTRTGTGPLNPADPQGLSPLDLAAGGQTQSGSSAPNAFNPALSVIPDVTYYADDMNGRGFAVMEEADGGAGPGGTEVHEHGGEMTRGFNLREVEIALSGAVDPYFDVWSTFAYSGDHLEAEEVYVQTRRLLPGLQLRAGRFFSGIGYINKQHPHQWDFADQALPVQLLLGGGLAETGVQMTWLPRLPTYLLVGVEALQGENAALSNQLAGAFPDQFTELAGPRLFTAFVKVAPDLGFSEAVQIGASFTRSRSHQEFAEVGRVATPLEGANWLAGADVVWRHDSEQAYGEGDFALQAEYFVRHKVLDHVPGPSRPVGGPYSATTDGIYIQATYGIAQRVTAGGRFDALGWINRINAGGATSMLGDSNRASMALTFNPTEFSRLRVQYDTGRIARNGTRGSLQQLFVQLQMSLGAHGAHPF
jgi:hypothetical protein